MNWLRPSQGSWLLLACALFGGAASADAIQPQPLTISTSEQPVPVSFFAAPGTASRPSVVIVHGANGVTPDSVPHFARYATALAAHGIDAYVVSYYSRSDVAAMASLDPAIRHRSFLSRLGPWARIVGDVVSYAIAQPTASGKIGLLGLSNGGFISVTESALDPRVAALVVLYGGIPKPMEGRIHRLPPLLELHGDADRNVPLSEGNALVAKARDLGGPVQQIVYPGEGHGFDADPDKPDTHDAVDRAVGFFAQMLK